MQANAQILVLHLKKMRLMSTDFHSRAVLCHPPQTSSQPPLSEPILSPPFVTVLFILQPKVAATYCLWRCGEFLSVTKEKLKVKRDVGIHLTVNTAHISHSSIAALSSVTQKTTAFAEITCSQRRSIFHIGQML